LAPIPSGYFVARASREHLSLPLPIAIVIGTIIEFLGIASIHTWLWLADWNATKRKRDPEAPTDLAILLGGIYILSTVGLTVVLEVVPSLSTYAPAIFPILAVVGAVNLALIAQQEGREQTVKHERQFRRVKRKWGNVHLDPKSVQTVNPLSMLTKVENPLSEISPLEIAKKSHPEISPLQIPDLHNEHVQNEFFPLDTLDTVKVNTKVDIMNTLVNALAEDPDSKVADMARLVGRSRTTIYKYLAELEQAGRISRNNK
jgi:hypothetical protein